MATKSINLIDRIIEIANVLGWSALSIREIDLGNLYFELNDDSGTRVALDTLKMDDMYSAGRYGDLIDYLDARRRECLLLRLERMR